jgi:hypothetical protein
MNSCWLGIINLAFGSVETLEDVGTEGEKIGEVF